MLSEKMTISLKSFNFSLGEKKKKGNGRDTFLCETKMLQRVEAETSFWGWEGYRVPPSSSEDAFFPPLHCSMITPRSTAGANHQAP